MKHDNGRAKSRENQVPESMQASNAGGKYVLIVRDESTEREKKKNIEKFQERKDTGKRVGEMRILPWIPLLLTFFFFLVCLTGNSYSGKD